MSSTGPKLDLAVLDKPVAYTGEGISVRSLADAIQQERSVQDAKGTELETLRTRNTDIQAALAKEVAKLRKFSDYLDGTATRGGIWAGFKEVLSYIPGLRSMALSRR